MPVDIGAELVCMSQNEFSAVAYQVMNEAFYVHRELGPLFDEKIYQNALASLIEDLQTEVRLVVKFRDFCKTYFMDVVASSGAIFELKTVDRLNSKHRGQLLNYLLLTGQKHGKLINFRSAQVQHEFVNSPVCDADRFDFSVDDTEWFATDGFCAADKMLVIEMLRDWGTGLSRELYEEAIVHLCGGSENGFSEVDVFLDDSVIAKQSMLLCAKRIALRITSFDHGSGGYYNDLSRMIRRTDVDQVQWINIDRGALTFKTLG